MKPIDKPYILLDYNVVKYIKNGYAPKDKNGDCSKDGVALSHLVQRLKRKYCFPICESHLLDLKKSVNPGNEDRVLDDLRFMSEMSNNTALFMKRDGDQKIVLFEGVDIKDHFQKILSENEPQQPINIITGRSFNVDMDKVDEDSIFMDELQKNNGLMDKDVIKNVLREIWINIDNPVYYNKFKKNIIMLRDNLMNNDTSISDHTNEIEKAIKYLDFFNENDDDLFDGKAMEFCSWLSEVGGVKIDSMNLHYKIQNLYMVLDFHPILSEKTDKKNKPSNIMRDCKAAIFGSSAEYLVTEDNKFYRKIKIVYRILGIRTKTVKMSEFMDRFL
ncbi:hypothetical protein [Azospirillum cavernae]|uniref:hypothetical protein n=1 Tax=Azospirillum cavernae TaxID=2320860 RepID=UPI0011C4838D|nr:hypothetical protein [Azospirillum cavernae]